MNKEELNKILFEQNLLHTPEYFLDAVWSLDSDVVMWNTDGSKEDLYNQDGMTYGEDCVKLTQFGDGYVLVDIQAYYGNSQIVLKESNRIPWEVE